MAVMELVVNQKYFNQLVVNRFHYLASGTPAAVTLSFGLLHASGFLSSRLAAGIFPDTTLAGQVQNIQSNALTFVSAYARDLYSVTDFYEGPFPTGPAGTRTGDALSPTSAFGFFGSRVRTDIRRGQKRFAGVTEAQVDSGGVITSTMNAAMVNVADKIGATITYDDEGNTLTYVPCVMGLLEYETESGRKAYHKYPDPADQLEHLAVGGAWSHYPQVRTQVSRQYGRGV
jgi:hypothetical protein